MKNIKSITSFRTDIAAFDSNINDDNLYKYHTIEFNEDGKAIRELVFAPNGKIKEEVINTYNEEGKLEENLLNHTEDGTSEKTTYKYDEKGNVTEEVLWFGDEPFERTVTAYDAQGNKKEVIKYDEENVQTERDIFEYNADNKPLKQLHYNGSEEEPEWTLEMEYDANGNLVCERHNNFIEDIDETMKYEYNEDNKKIKTEVFDKSGKLISLITYEYDENGNPEKQLSQSSGRMPMQHTRTVLYDEENRPVEIMVYDDMRKFLSSQELFTYDENGNVTEREVFELSASDTLQKNHYRLKLEYEFFS